VSLPDGLTVARAASVPFVILLYALDFDGHNYWATALFAAAMATDWFDGRIARSRGRSSPLGSLLDPAADKILVLAALVILVASVVPVSYQRVTGHDVALTLTGKGIGTQELRAVAHRASLDDAPRIRRSRASRLIRLLVMRRQPRTVSIPGRAIAAAE